MNKIEYRLYKTDKNSYVPLLIESVYLDGSPYFIYTRLSFIWKKPLTREIVRYLLGLDQDSKTGGINYNFIISRCAYKSDCYFFEWLFEQGFSEINLIRREDIYI